jgi:tetratricopeptide (TPR) repeat protein
LRTSLDTVRLGMLSGAAAVVAQNFVDFSLELPGVALPVAAVLGGTSVKTFREVEPAEHAIASYSIFGLITACLIATLTFGLLHGMPLHTVAELDRRIDRVKNARIAVDPALFDRYAYRHPASGEVAIRLSFLAEVSHPPDLKSAAKHVNRSLYLAPTSADAHRALARLLIKAGHRKQGFEAMRRAWELSASGSRAAFILEAISLARNAEELVLSVPLRDPALGLLDEVEAVRLLRELVRAEREAWIPAVLTRLSDLRQLGPPMQLYVGQLALSSGTNETADRLIDAISETEQDPRMMELKAKLIERIRGTDAVVEFLDRTLEGPGRKNPGLIESRLDIALARRDLDTAKNLVRELERVAPTDRNGQARVERARAGLYEAEGNLARAARALSRAIGLDPVDVRLRIRRVRILIDLDRLDDARAELASVLEVDPKNEAAGRLRTRIDQMEAQRGNPTLEQPRRP